MKKIVAVTLFVAMLLPGAAFAGASTDAALGLGAFAVVNQIIGGTGIFGRAAVAQPVVVAPPPPPAVVYAPPPPPAVVYEPYPVYQQTTVYEPYPVYTPAPVYQPRPVYYSAPRRVVVYEREHWCPPGHRKHGRC